MLRVFLIILSSVLIGSCQQGNQDTDSQHITTENTDQLPKEKKDRKPNRRNKPQPKGWTYTLEDRVLKIFQKEDSFIVYERPYHGQVTRHSGGLSGAELYHVYLELENDEDLIVVCNAGTAGALLELNIPDSMAGYYVDFHSGGVHSQSPSGKFLALDQGTGSDRLLRIYGLNTNKEIAQISYKAPVQDAKWDASDRLTYYNPSPPSDSLPSTIIETDSLTGVKMYYEYFYEQIWEPGQATKYTGKYVKALQE